MQVSDMQKIVLGHDTSPGTNLNQLEIFLLLKCLWLANVKLHGIYILNTLEPWTLNV